MVKKALTVDQKFDLILQGYKVAKGWFSITGVIGLVLVGMVTHYIKEINVATQNNRVAISEHTKNIAVLHSKQTSILKWQDQVNVKLDKVMYRTPKGF